MVRQVAEEWHIALTTDEEDLLAARFNQMAEVFVGITPMAMPPRFPLPDLRRERDVISRGQEVRPDEAPARRQDEDVLATEGVH